MSTISAVASQSALQAQPLQAAPKKDSDGDHDNSKAAATTSTKRPLDVVA